MRVGILGSGDVAQALGAGFLKYGHEVMLGTRDPAKLAEWAAEHAGTEVGSFADVPPTDGVLHFFTDLEESLMERLQREFPEARFVKAFNSVGNAHMVDPQFAAGKPTMFVCGDDEEAKRVVGGILDRFGWEVADMGAATAARAIEPLCILWCIPGFLRNQWAHAFKLLT